jgi:hypothetical protein
MEPPPHVDEDPVSAYGEFLGFDLRRHPQLRPLMEAGAKAAPPQGWKQLKHSGHFYHPGYGRRSRYTPVDNRVRQKALEMLREGATIGAEARLTLLRQLAAAVVLIVLIVIALFVVGPAGRRAVTDPSPREGDAMIPQDDAAIADGRADAWGPARKAQGRRRAPAPTCAAAWEGHAVKHSWP